MLTLDTFCVPICHFCLQNKSRLDLVVFRYAAEHMTRISRIIKQPYGNALLVSCLSDLVLGSSTHAACV